MSTADYAAYQSWRNPASRDPPSRNWGKLWAGSSNKRSNKPLIYPAMALGAYRLLMLDLRQDRTAALFLSLLVHGWR